MLVGDGGGGLPPVPTRDQVCRVRLSFFGGVIVDSADYGLLPWYDMAMFAVSPSDRAQAFAGKRRLGDRHCLISFDDDEGGYVNRLGPYANIKIPYSHKQHPDLMRRDTIEILTNGFLPIVNLGSDGPGGIVTAKPNLEALVDCLGADDLMRYVLVMPGWDGTFYGWTPDELQEFGAFFRACVPNGYLAVEHDPGHIPCGGGAGDWDRDTGRMRDYDVVLSEFDFPGGNMDTVWQVGCRLLGPAWRRPDDCPEWIDTQYAIDHWYLGTGSRRGPYYPIAFETWNPFRWVQQPQQLQALAAAAGDIASQRAYLSSCGWGDCTG